MKKSRLDLLREMSSGPKPARVTPGDPVFCSGIGDGRVVATTAGTCWIRFDKTDSGPYDMSSTSTAANIPDLAWTDSRWVIDVEKLGAAGDGPGVRRYVNWFDKPK